MAPQRASLTYAEFGGQLDAIARALAAAGFGRSSRIGIVLPDGPEFAVAVLAVCCSASCAPLNQRLEPETLIKLLTALRLEALIVEEGADSPVVQVARRIGVALLRVRAELNEGAGRIVLLAEQSREAVPPGSPVADDVAFISHTSGTTSTPKIVPYEQWRVAEAARNRVGSGELNRADRILLLTPLYSLGSIRRSLLPPLLVGASIICPATRDGQAIVDILERLAPTQFVANPATLMAVLEEFERRSPRPKHSLRCIFVSYAELSDAVKARVEHAFGVPVLQSYGMTEAGNIAQTPFPPASSPAGSVGRSHNAAVAVADATVRILGADAQGEILVRGPEVFAGYEDDDEANRNAFLDGWFRTGDLGRIDRDGFIYLEGRIKDFINRGGAKISPREVEDALAEHPDVIEAAAFAVPHPTLGEDVAAAIVPRGSKQISVDDLRRQARGQLAAYKVPARIITIAQLPRTALGKVDRAALARMAEESRPAAVEQPRGAEEATVARIFAEVLGVADIGRQDGFFDRGGDSLRGMRVLARVEETWGVKATLELLLDHPTVAGFAAALGKPPARPPHSAH